METKQNQGVLTASSSLHIIEIDPLTDPRWEALMTNISAGPVYHPAWLKVLEEAYNYKPVHLACENTAGQVVGILPLFYRRGWRNGRFTSVFTGPLASDEKAMTALVQAAIERTRNESRAQMHLKVMSNSLDDLTDDLVGIPVYETYMLALPERAELLPLNSSIKRAIDKAIKLNVQVHEAESERELRTWYDLYVQTMRRLGALPKPYHFFELAWKQLHSQGLLRLLLAERIEAGKRKMLAGFLYLQWGQTVSYTTVGWRQENQTLRPNDILHWQAIQDACAAGFRWYDFGDVELGNEGLARYKTKWGAEAKMVYHYSYPASLDRLNSSPNLSRNTTHQLIRPIWRLLPKKAIGLVSDWYHALGLY